MRPVHQNFRIAQAATDSPIRTLVEAQSEQRSDVLRTKADLQSADGFTARTADFPAGNSLVAGAATAEATLASAPAANSLYEAHFKVTINPVIPGVGTNSHKVTVAVDTDPLATGVWTEQFAFEYEVIKKVGELNTPLVWPSERLPVRVTGIAAGGKLRLRIKVATGPGGWSFSVHGFNLATDLDLLSGVTYHTGPAIDFLDGGGATLADVVLSKISATVTDGYETDLGGPALSPDVAPFIVARTVWGKDDSDDIAVDRFIANLNPCVDGIPGNKEVVYFVCQPWALKGAIKVPKIANGEYLASLVPLSDPVRVPAGAGTSAQDYVFSWHERNVVGPGHTIITLGRKPRPKSIQPGFTDTDFTFVVHQEHDQSPTTFWFIWAVKADGTPAGNVGWARNSAVTEVVNGSRKLRTVQVRRLLDAWFIEGPAAMGAGTRPVFRCEIQCGSYVAAELDYTGGGNLIDLGAIPTETVTFTGIAQVPDGTGSIFEVRNNADSAWLPFTDGQTAAEIGVSQRQTYKVRWRGTPNSQADATPTMWEMGARDIKKTWVSDLIASIKARWAIPNVAEMTAEIPELEITLIHNGEQDFADRVRKLLSTNTIGSLAFRVWRGDPSRPRNEWLHKDDFVLIDDYDPTQASTTIVAHSALVLLNGALPVYNTTTQLRTPLQISNKTPRAAYAEIIANQLAPDVPARYQSDGITDESCLVTKLIDASDGLTELSALAHIADTVISTSGGRIRAFPMGTQGAPVAIFPSAKIKWRSSGPGLRQRVPRFYVKYGFDTLAQKFTGEARCISGNDILATNLQPSRIDAETELREDVGRWIPNEELAKRVGQRRVNRLGAGMLVWAYTSDELRAELEFGDVVSLETDRFFARDPSQTQQRTLKGAMWVLGRIVEYDIEGKEFGVWVQYADIYGANDASILIGYVTPIVTAIQLHVDDGGAVKANIAVTDGQAIKLAVTTGAMPSDATVRAAGLQVLDSNGQLSTAVLANIVPGDVLSVKVFAYELANGGGTESLAATGATPKGTWKRTFLVDDGFRNLKASDAAGSLAEANVKLVPTVGVLEGGVVQLLYRHREEIIVTGPDADGDVAVTFAQVYQNAPMVIFKGGQYVSFSQTLGTGAGAKHRLRLQAINITTTGFISRSIIVNTGTTTAQDDDFPAADVLTAAGQTTELALNPGGANDANYNVQYFASVTLSAPGVDPSVSLTVAIETDDGLGGGFIERATFVYARSTAGTSTFTHEQKIIVVTGLVVANGAKIRLRAKSFLVHDATGSFIVRGGDNGATDTFHGVQYTTAADTPESAIPAAGDQVIWVAQEVT